MIEMADLTRIRAYEPTAIQTALESRTPGPGPLDGRKSMIIACDHPARGALGAGEDPRAMGNRGELLARCQAALARPGVTGFLGTADMIEDLVLLGALEGKNVYGSMNRGGLKGARFEMDDRFTCYDAEGIIRSHLDGGKTLTRINFDDDATADTLESTSQAVDALADAGKRIMIEPFISRWEGKRIVNDLSTDAVITSIAIAAGLGRTSAYTWLKLPCVADMERVMAATTLPALILGGEVSEDPDAMFEGWSHALALPNVLGLVVGRSLLYPPDGDVERAVDQAVELL
ncbi:Cgl0159 family (beta/alpha)8-fold protein [Flaviflexus equikiangi]|uniref:Cgl0159 family (beta/alpha)8-fold protein n=1 Tax=Flaviflexus equikiangi TaxID=2758573 RepID=UPI0015F405B7|nr:deoxyribose-phosphate aldolase [Flaviflexus equikiangi]